MGKNVFQSTQTDVDKQQGRQSIKIQCTQKQAAQTHQKMYSLRQPACTNTSDGCNRDQLLIWMQLSLTFSEISVGF